MPQPWNPSAPETQGLELYAPTSSVATPTSASALWQRFVAQVTETVTDLEVACESATSPAPTDLIADVYPAGAMVAAPTTPVTQTFAPNETVARVGWVNQTGGTTNLHLNVDDAPPGTADGISEPNPTGTGNAVRFRFATAGFAGIGANDRVVRTYLFVTHFGGNIEVQLWDETAGVALTDPVRLGAVTSGGARTDRIEFGDVLPTAADVARLDADVSVRLVRISNASGFVIPRVYSLQLGVECVVEERVATGRLVAGVSGTFATWAGEVNEPGTTTGWPKVGGTEYDVVLRPAKEWGGGTTGSTPLVPFLASLATSPDWEASGFGPGWKASGAAQLLVNRNGMVQAIGANDHRLYPLYFRNAAFDYDQDSIAYSRMSPASGFVRQSFRTQGPAYSAVRALVRVPPSPVGAQSLTFQLRNVGTGVAVPGVAVVDRIAARQGESMGNGWYVIVVPFDPLVSGLAINDDYWLEVTPVGDWRVAHARQTARIEALPGGGSLFVQLAQWTYGGVTTGEGEDNEAQVGGVTVAASDLVALVMEAVGGPSGADATPDAVAFDPGDVPDMCDRPTTRGTVVVSWSPSSLNAAFERYEIQRSDLPGEWATVAVITDEDENQWTDHEPRFGVETTYRIRSVRFDGAWSEWSTAAAITVAQPECGLWFSSDDPAETLFLPDLYGAGAAVRGFTFLDADGVRLLPMEGRDYQVAFRPTERRGVTFSRTVLLNALDPVLRASMREFAPLLDMARDPQLPYVVVRDHEGNRWYASVVVTEGNVRQPADLVSAVVTITEVAGVPVPVVAP